MGQQAELAHLFRSLKTPAAARALPKLADRARREEWSYEQFVQMLLETEVSARDSHGGEARIRQARFPARKTLEEFDFTFQRSVRKQVIEHLGQLDFLHAKECIVALGPQGGQFSSGLDNAFISAAGGAKYPAWARARARAASTGRISRTDALNRSLSRLCAQSVPRRAAYGIVAAVAVPVSPGAPLSFSDPRPTSVVYVVRPQRVSEESRRATRSHVNNVNPQQPRHVHKRPAHKSPKQQGRHRPVCRSFHGNVQAPR
jgi:hypothetical protein